MDTKLKNYKGRRRSIIFIVSFIICVTSFIGCTQAACYIAYLSQSEGFMDAEDILRQNDYLHSEKFTYDISNITHILNSMLNIKQTEEDITDKTMSLQLEEYETVLGEYGKFVYYAEKAGAVVASEKSLEKNTNLNANVSKYPAYFIFEDKMITKEPQSYRGDQYYSLDLDTIYLGFPQTFLDERGEAHELALGQITRVVIIMIILGLTALISLILSIVCVGKKNAEGEIQRNWFDCIFTEVQIAAILALFLGCGYGYFMLCEQAYFGYPYSAGQEYGINVFLLWIANIVGVITATLGLSFILSIIKNMKCRSFFRNFLILKPFYSFSKKRKQFKGGGKLSRKAFFTFGGVTFCVLGIMWMILIAVAQMYISFPELVLLTALIWGALMVLFYLFAMPHIKKYELISNGVEIVKNGDLSYKIPVDGYSELNRLADGINRISDGFHIAVENEVKSERLKAELISNVSHDIKTPLTSMITYVDLLKREGLDSENAPNYLRIVEEKTLRLKKLTEDLFEAAKASTGNIPVNMESVELLSLVNQALGEMDEKLAAKGLHIIVSGKADKYYVRADGQLMWRVLENLLGNLEKYAQENSRVYIDLDERQRSVSVTGQQQVKLMTVMVMKNVSKYQLNVTSAELMERFNRGDESRSTDGSGLGLSIASDLMSIQNGTFDIQVDGDLFKAIISVPTATSQVTPGDAVVQSPETEPTPSAGGSDIQE